MTPEQKFPFKYPGEDDLTKQCDCNACQLARREGYLEGLKDAAHEEVEGDAVGFGKWMRLNGFFLIA